MTRLAYTVQEVAELLGIGVATVWRLVKKGDLQVIHLRGATRVTATSVNALLREAV